MPVFLFTDIEGSTKKWEKYKDAMEEALPRHDVILKESITKHGGSIIKHTGDGIFAIFDNGDPLQCAIDIQKQLAQENWGLIGELRIRIGIHSGHPEKRGEDYFGPVINRTARVMSVGWGGQVLLTPEVVNCCRLPKDAKLEDFGVHILKDLGEPQQIYGLIHPDLLLQKFPPLRSLSAHPHNLPSQLTPFVGRKEDLAEIAKLLDKSSCRMLTLVGSGGSGKTRLALQVAAEKIEEFHHGVFFVPLAPLTLSSSQFLVFTIADALNFSFFSREDPKKQLLNFLREKEILLIMDNFEHLIEEAELMADILKDSPTTKILVTSRERLNIKGEWVYDVKGMRFPENGELDVLEDYSALLLFMQDAQRFDPDIALNEETEPHIVRICQLVNGLPLAIELASAWVRSLSLKEIAEEIERNIDFLISSMRDIPERHRSLRAVFDYSWELLPERHQKGFMKVSIFRGGFTREAADKVAGLSFSSLTALIDKSLLHRNPAGRYEMLETVRQYAVEKLEEDHKLKEEIQDRHTQYYGNFLKLREERLRAGKQKETLEEIGQEIENLRIGWDSAIRNNEKDQIEVYIEGLYHFYELRAWYKEGIREFEKAIAVFKDDKENLIYNKLLGRLGYFYFRQDQYDKAKENLNFSLNASRKLHNDKEIAFCLNGLGNVTYMLRGYEKAKTLYQKCLDIAKKIGDRKGVATALHNIGNVDNQLGEYDDAKRLYTESLQIFQEVCDQWGAAHALNNLGIVANNLAEYDESKKLYLKSLTIKRELGDKLGVATSLFNLGSIETELGEYEEAKRYYEESKKICVEMGFQNGIVRNLVFLGNLAYNSGNLAEAKEQFYESLKIIKETNMPLIIQPDALIGVANLMIKEGKKEEGLTLLCLVRDYPEIDSESKGYAEKAIADSSAEYSPEEMNVAEKNAENENLEEFINKILKY